MRGIQRRWGEILTNRNDSRAERTPDGQSTGTDESSYSTVVKISGKKKQPHQKEDPKPVSASPCKEARKVGSEGTSPRSRETREREKRGQVRKKKPTTHSSRRKRA